MKPTDEQYPSGPLAADEADVQRVVAEGPRGSLWVAGIATAIVFAIWFIFYFAVFVPRGALS